MILEWVTALTKKSLIVINLLGGPGSGKSTTASGIYYNLKKQHYNVELVTEFIKDRIYEDSALGCIEDQIYIFGQQQRRISRLVGKVDIAVTDSPIILSCLYSKIKSPTFEKLVKEVHFQYNNVNFYLDRNGDIPYTENGRMQNLTQSMKLDQKLLALLCEAKIEFDIVKAGDKSVEEIIDMLKRYKIIKGEYNE